MENIASQLKQARLDLGMSIEDAVTKSKFTLAQIKAIESGDLDFFKADLSYFSYMIRYYSNVLHYDYELLRDDVEAIVAQDEFTQEIEQLRQNVQIKTKQASPKKNTTGKKKRRKKQIDYSFLAFLFSSILLVLVLLYVGVKYVPKWFKEDPVKPPVVVEPGDDTNGDTPSETPEEPDDEVEKETLVVTPLVNDPTQIEIKGWEEDQEVDVKLVFKAEATWISASVNNVVLTEPLSTTYFKDDEIVVKEKASENKEIMFHLGKMLGNEFYVNDQKVELDENIQNNAGVVKLYFKFIKESD